MQGRPAASQVDLAAGIDSARQRVRDRVFQSFADSPSGQIRKLAEMLAPIRPGLVVSDDALANCAARPTEAEWARFVGACDLLRGSVLSRPNRTPRARSAHLCIMMHRC